MERGRSILADQMPGAKAPSAAQPGRGIGNIPYAGGMASGQFGARLAAIQPRRDEPMPAAGAPIPPPQPPPSGGPPSPPAAPPGPMAPPQSPYLNPMFYFNVMGSYLEALHKAASSEGGFY